MTPCQKPRLLRGPVTDSLINLVHGQPVRQIGLLEDFLDVPLKLFLAAAEKIIGRGVVPEIRVQVALLIVSGCPFQSRDCRSPFWPMRMGQFVTKCNENVTKKALCYIFSIFIPLIIKVLYDFCNNVTHKTRCFRFLFFALHCYKLPLTPLESMKSNTKFCNIGHISLQLRYIFVTFFFRHHYIPNSPEWLSIASAT